MPRPTLRLITTFGLGTLRPAPGTWGSLPPVVLAALLMAVGLGPDQSPWIFRGVFAVMLVVFSWACVRDADAAEARFGRKDPSEVVADETAGQCIPLLMLTGTVMTSPALAAASLLYAFFAFRVLDIIKPWPAFMLQRVPGGWGILLDDLFAGFYAGLLLLMVVYGTQA
ncbi:MAG: phosphatidylglycerophosphatase A [Phycisphaeraceae bacterium]|nr:phosphatidylglycerophosphatase A [Phycisphaeraceae bacterium]